MTKISTVIRVKNIEMSATSPLESEDLENIPLVRMADVQPDRNRMYMRGVKSMDVCKQDLASVVSIKTEDKEADEEFIVPDKIKTEETMIIKVEKAEVMNDTGSWPTLEILPGGVIKHAEKQLEDLIYHSEDFGIGDNDNERIYACAKCHHRFKYLFSLVKHVRRHEDQKKREKYIHEAQRNIQKKKSVYLQNKKKVMSKLKTKCKVPKKS